MFLFKPQEFKTASQMSSQDCQEVEGLWCVAFSGSSELVVPSIIAVGLDVSGERERERATESDREREREGGARV